MLDTMMGACWEDVVISGTCDTRLSRESVRLNNLPRRALRRRGGRAVWPLHLWCLPS